MAFTPINSKNLYSFLDSLPRRNRLTCLAVASDLLYHAAQTKEEVQGEELQRGQALCGIRGISERTGASLQQVRTALKRLKANRFFLTTNLTLKTHVITICNFDSYIEDGRKSNTQTNTQTNTTPKDTDKYQGVGALEAAHIQAQDLYGLDWTVSLEGYWSDGFGKDYPINWPGLIELAKTYSPEQVEEAGKHLFLSNQEATKNPIGLLTAVITNPKTSSNGKTSAPVLSVWEFQKAEDRRKKAIADKEWEDLKNEKRKAGTYRGD